MRAKEESYLKKYLLILLVSALGLGLLAGCSQDQTPPVQEEITETVKLYYGDNGNENIVFEEREISYLEGQDRYSVILDELFKGPKTADYQANISPETKIYGTIVQGKDLIVDLSQEFAQFGGSVGEIVGVLSLVNTLTQFPEIERVKILVEGMELIAPSGQPYPFISYTENGNNAQAELKKFILYFANADATKVAAELREIELPLAVTLEQIITSVLEELVKGPVSTNLSRTIPSEVQILSVRIEGDTLFIDFSEEMHSKHWGGATGEAMTINSIVATLTEFENLNYVKMTVAGQPMNIEHSILDEPVGRNEEMIEK